MTTKNLLKKLGYSCGQGYVIFGTYKNIESFTNVDGILKIAKRLGWWIEVMQFNNTGHFHWHSWKFRTHSISCQKSYRTYLQAYTAALKGILEYEVSLLPNSKKDC